jgi:hypothetical protein
VTSTLRISWSAQQQARHGAQDPLKRQARFADEFERIDAGNFEVFANERNPRAVRCSTPFLGDNRQTFYFGERYHERVGAIPAFQGSD